MIVLNIARIQIRTAGLNCVIFFRLNYFIVLHLPLLIDNKTNTFFIISLISSLPDLVTYTNY